MQCFVYIYTAVYVTLSTGASPDMLLIDISQGLK